MDFELLIFHMFCCFLENISDALGERLHISDEVRMKKVRDAIDTVAEEPS